MVKDHIKDHGAYRFSSTSVNARREVKMQLLNLTRKITRLLSQLEEDDPDDRRTDSRTNATGH